MRTFAEFMLIAEGMTMKDFKANRKKLKRREDSADAKKRGHVGKEWYNSGRTYSSDEAKRSRAKMDDEERRTRHRSAVDPDNEDDNNYSADKTKNPKKLRKQQAMGELGEAYDKDVMQSSQIRKTGEGGRIGAERRKSTPERRRVRAVGGGKTEPVQYKDRKDIGTQRQASTRVQQPEQERGSARERQLAAAKEERRKAAQARAAAKKGGETATAAKPSAKEAEKTASKLLSKKKAASAPAPGYTPRKASGLTAQERDKKVRRPGERKLRDLILQATGKKSESELKHPITAKEVVRRNAEAKKKG
jgi:hypothetical protein